MSDSVNLSGYHLTFDAEMTSSADANQFINTYANGDRTIYSNGEAEEYLNDNPSSPNNPYSFANGALTITASPSATGPLPYTSGILDTVDTFSQNQGYFEIRAQLTDAAGFWPAFWLLAPDYSAEVDILEQPNKYGDTNYFNSIKTSTLNIGVLPNTGVDLGAGYHTYGFMWTGNSVQFTFDGQYIGYPVETPPALASVKLYVLANLGVGGPYSWPGSPTAGASAQYSIDYIRVLSNDPTVPGVAQEPISSPDGVDTTPTNLPEYASVGTGSDALVLQFAEDAYLGDAQFTVSVDGVQQGGVYTASGLKALRETQALTIHGNYGSGSHSVAVDFLNDAYGGSPSADRNLYLTQATLNGSAILNSSLALYSGGLQSLSFVGAGSLLYQPTTVIGSGVDVLALHVSEDAYLGDAQFTVSVDGKQVGGTQTAAALHNVGGAQELDVLGTFAPGAHTVSVNFLNGAPSGSPSLGRNLYLNSATLDGTSVASSSLAEYSNGAQSFSFQKAATDTLTLGVSEDAYQGDAQYRVLVDGVDTGNTYTATASHAAGQITQQTVTGNWGAGPHQIGVQFINDAWGGSSSLDRNLYINSASYDGKLVGMAPTEQASNGIATVSLPVASNLTLHLAEDAYQGDAQFIVTVDGQQIDQPTPVSALHAAGASQAFDFEAYLAPDSSHDVGVTFLNDAWGGSPALDRNLFVMGADLNGTSLNPSSWTTALYSNGTQHFSLNIPQ